MPCWSIYIISLWLIAGGCAQVRVYSDHPGGETTASPTYPPPSRLSGNLNIFFLKSEQKNLYEASFQPKAKYNKINLIMFYYWNLAIIVWYGLGLV